MLKEFKKIRQVEHIHRKLFSDNYFDLYLWYRLNKEDFLGFQLVFNVNSKQMALTAEINKVPDIHIVDCGDDLFYDPTDVLDGIGFFPKKELYNNFLECSSNIDTLIRENILKVINSYNVPNIDEKFKLEPLH